jgi:hypothetical protein
LARFDALLFALKLFLAFARCCSPLGGLGCGVARTLAVHHGRRLPRRHRLASRRGSRITRHRVFGGGTLLGRNAFAPRDSPRLALGIVQRHLSLAWPGQCCAATLPNIVHASRHRESLATTQFVSGEGGLKPLALGPHLRTF